MSLRDLKPGDRFTAEFMARHVGAAGVRISDSFCLYSTDEGRTVHAPEVAE